MARIAEVSYDEENDLLYVGYKGRKVKDSLEIDKFVIDFGVDGEMVGVEVFDASKVIKGLNQSNITKEMISNLHEAKIRIHKSQELVFFVIALYTGVKSKGQPIVLQVPKPVMAYA